MDSNPVAPQNRLQQPFIQEFEILEEERPEPEAKSTLAAYHSTRHYTAAWI